MLVITGLALVLLYLGAMVFGWLLFEAHEPGTLEPLVSVDADETGFTMQIGSSQFLFAFLAALVVLVVVHEGIHGLAYRLRSYDVSYGVAPQMGAFYAAAFHQFQSRDDNLVVGIAPLLVIDAVLLALLSVPIPIVAVAAFLGLVFNTAGAAGDLYLVAKLLRMPEDALLYDSDVRHMYVFNPEA